MNLLRHGFANPWALTLLALLPVLGIGAFLDRRRRRRALARLGSVHTLRALTSGTGRGGVIRAFNLTSALVLLLVGIAGPQWGRDWQQPPAPGRDLVVVLDLSRSMLAQDVLPSRQERAKQALTDLSNALQQRGGHRLGLVAFAARARLVCPLTHDYDHFRSALADLDAAQPHRDVRPGKAGSASGTRIGAGLRAAVEAHDPRARGYQDILLLSDGDDPVRDAEWRAGADEARRQEVPVHTVGLGDPNADSRIPLKADNYLQHEGQFVLTRLHEGPLQEIAARTNGTYIPARTQPLALGDLLRDRLEARGPRDDMEDTLPVYHLRYAWFLAPALSLLALDMAAERGWRRRKGVPS
jgi:Ca-activated chloride channel family protein